MNVVHLVNGIKFHEVCNRLKSYRLRGNLETETVMEHGTLVMKLPISNQIHFRHSYGTYCSMFCYDLSSLFCSFCIIMEFYM